MEVEEIPFSKLILHESVGMPLESITCRAWIDFICDIISFFLEP
jgi:hypothetical protein